MPAQTGLDLYSFSKGVGHEISRVFTQHYPGFHVLTTLCERNDCDWPLRVACGLTLVACTEQRAQLMTRKSSEGIG